MSSLCSSVTLHCGECLNDKKFLLFEVERKNNRTSYTSDVIVALEEEEKEEEEEEEESKGCGRRCVDGRGVEEEEEDV